MASVKVSSWLYSFALAYRCGHAAEMQNQRIEDDSHDNNHKHPSALLRALAESSSCPVQPSHDRTHPVLSRGHRARRPALQQRCANTLEAGCKH